MTTMTVQPDFPTTPVPVTLPTRQLLLSVVLSSLVAGGLVSLLGVMMGWADWDRAGIWGGVLVAICTAGGVLAITPWKPRPMTMWVAIWLGQTVVRMLVTPAAAYLLYSATSIRPMALAAAVGSCYLAAVVVEARVLTRILATGGATDGAADNGNSNGSNGSK